MLASQKQEIIALIQNAVSPLLAGSELNPVILLERPRDPSHGDIACNIAMQIAKPLKKNPREIAQAIVASVLEQSQAQTAPLVASVEIAGPGFINIRLTAASKQAIVQTILQQQDNFGKGSIGTGKKLWLNLFLPIQPDLCMSDMVVKAHLATLWQHC